MYKEAIKNKFRFATGRGLVPTEELYDIPLINHNGPSLDKIAKSLNKELKELAEESFVIASTPKSSVIEKKLNIVKDVIADKLREAQEAEALVSKRQKKAKLVELLARKQDADLEGKSTEDIQKMIDNLD